EIESTFAPPHRPSSVVQVALSVYLQTVHLVCLQTVLVYKFTQAVRTLQL
ncbi:uncharacterized protein B0H18DRAFT_939459, partial [Fomitopsis serialis]